nr:reverse transcriptase [Tanacetum cinerariifolium]
SQDHYYQTSRSHRSSAPSPKPLISSRSHTTTRHKGKEIAKPITSPSETASEKDSDTEQAQRDKDMQKNLALIAKYSRRSTNLPTTTSKHPQTPRTRMENVGSKGVLLQAEQYDWLEDTDEEVDEQELEAHYSYMAKIQEYDWLEDTDKEVDEQELEAHYNYMAKIQEVPNADSGTDSEPVKQVQNDVGYNVFANELQHSDQSESVCNTCLAETDDSNVTTDSPDICDDDIHNDQNDVESDDEHVALANLIANLKLDVDENKKIQKQLKKANTTLAQELKECKTVEHPAQLACTSTSSPYGSLSSLEAFSDGDVIGLAVSLPLCLVDVCDLDCIEGFGDGADDLYGARGAKWDCSEPSIGFRVDVALGSLGALWIGAFFLFKGVTLKLQSFVTWGVYVCQPPEFEDPDYPDKVNKIVKALYGLHQAPRAWSMIGSLMYLTSSRPEIMFACWFNTTPQVVVNSPCLIDKKELAIRGHTTTGKESSNLFMADSLPKTIVSTKLAGKRLKLSPIWILGAATTNSGLDARQGSDNIDKTPSMPHDSHLSRVNTIGSNKGSMTLNELMVLCTHLSKKVKGLENTLQQTRDVYDVVSAKLTKKGRFQQEIKHDVSTAGAGVSTTNEEEPSTPPTTKTVIFDDEDMTIAETLVKLRSKKSKNKTKEKGVVMKESKLSIEERSKLFVELINERPWKKYYARLRAEE